MRKCIYEKGTEREGEKVCERDTDRERVREREREREVMYVTERRTYLEENQN